jgi:hypothetical protein
MIEIIKEGKTCTQTPTGLWGCEGCTGIDDPSYPKIKVRLGSRNNQHWFELKNKDYLYMVQDEWCVIQLRPVEDTKTKRERWILGDTFLRAYDSVHDL